MAFPKMIRQFILSCLVGWLAASALRAEVPALFNVQGRLLLDSIPASGTVEFKFALTSANGAQTYWRNSPDADLDEQPDASVSLTLDRGLYAIALGDTNLANMAVLPPSVFTNGALYLRIWVDDGLNGFQHLAPDQRVTAAGFALISATVTDGAITMDKLAPGVSDNLAALTATVAGLSAQVALLTNQGTLPPAGLTAVSALNPDPTLAGHGMVHFMTVPAPAWVNGATTDAPSARAGHSSVWTGSEMVMWGGTVSPGVYSSAGGIYDPAQDEWLAVSMIAVPAARTGHGAVWTGSEMIIWGGFSSGGFLDTGARWQREPQTWTDLPTLNAPEARDGHIAVWTGSRLLIWGGRNSGGLLASGALYDPALNEWTSLALPDAPSARVGAKAVWTGTGVIIWGGEGEGGLLNDGAELVFTAGVPTAWRTLASQNAPSARSRHTAIWTGSRMIVWGGWNGGTPLGDGATYDAMNDSWAALEPTGAPAPRGDHNALWTGQEMLIFCGQGGAGPLATGGAFDPVAVRWRALSSSGNPVARTEATAIWTGTELLVFGGREGAVMLGALQRLQPQPDWHFYRKP